MHWSFNGVKKIILADMFDVCLKRCLSQNMASYSKGKTDVSVYMYLACPLNEANSSTLKGNQTARVESNIPVFLFKNHTPIFKIASYAVREMKLFHSEERNILKTQCKYTM